MKYTKQFAAVVALATALAVGPAASASSAKTGNNDARIQAQVSQKLQKSEFKNVQSTVNDGVVTLTGTVDTYKQKLDAEKRARKSDKQVQDVRDLIEVAAPGVSDAALQKKLSRSLAYDRVGYGETPCRTPRVSQMSSIT